MFEDRGHGLGHAHRQPARGGLGARLYSGGVARHELALLPWQTEQSWQHFLPAVAGARSRPIKACRDVKEKTDIYYEFGGSPPTVTQTDAFPMTLTVPSQTRERGSVNYLLHGMDGRPDSGLLEDR
jgi:hypothetical protein